METKAKLAMTVSADFQHPAQKGACDDVSHGVVDMLEKSHIGPTTQTTANGVRTHVCKKMRASML